ncbi:merozoite surface protein CMZ-8-like [Glycine soja]|nr:merozoite surface protein CMZ-8-like [Glycine max]XP_028199421.1 merozoite surface protein CMZ-8-like [Glycine soja]|eukprot:XP_014622259.1 merozoite surface protein CMZ-8-like [Glycine max]
MESRKRARTEDIPSSSTPAPPSVTVGQDVQSSLTLVPMLQSLFRGQFILMHSLQELAHNRPMIFMEHFLEQVACPEAQLPLVRPNEAVPPEPTHVQVNSEPANPQSPVVNPPSSPELETVPPSPPLIVISDASSDEAAAPLDSPAAKTVDPPVSPIGGISDLSDSSSGKVVALTDSPV